LEIFWGSADSYSPARTWWRTMPGGGLSVADLDGDGWLDFVVPGMFDAKRKSYNNQTNVYLGTHEGTPSAEPVAELEAYGSIECGIADLNRDGHLDLACTNYMSDSTRSLPMFVYWGSAGGRFSNSNRLVLPAESSAGIQTLDLNADGYPELVVHNHLKDGQHVTDSSIYWNGPGGFDRSRRTSLPGLGPHFSQMLHPGNLYTRKLEEYYESEPLDLGQGKRVKALRWSGEARNGGSLHLAARAADSPRKLQQAAWVDVSQDGLFRGPGQWVQYRATLRSVDAAGWPLLQAVQIETE
ncbi:MAG: VCBS repeat-containing protein, partial [Bryobacteraceae bacterium]